MATKKKSKKPAGKTPKLATVPRAQKVPSAQSKRDDERTKAFERVVAPYARVLVEAAEGLPKESPRVEQARLRAAEMAQELWDLAHALEKGGPAFELFPFVLEMIEAMWEAFNLSPSRPTVLHSLLDAIETAARDLERKSATAEQAAAAAFATFQRLEPAAATAITAHDLQPVVATWPNVTRVSGVGSKWTHLAALVSKIGVLDARGNPYDAGTLSGLAKGGPLDPTLPLFKRLRERERKR